MRKIKVLRWKAKNPDGSEIDESSLTALEVLLKTIPSDRMPMGLDKTRIFNRLVVSFDKAEESGILELEEADYSFLKSIVETNIPGIWGTNKDIMSAIDSFLDAKKE